MGQIATQTVVKEAIVAIPYVNIAMTAQACADGEGVWENTVNILTLPSCYINGHYEITDGELTWISEPNEEYVWSDRYCSI